MNSYNEKFGQTKPGGLDLSRRGLDRDSRSRPSRKSRQHPKVSLNDRDISISSLHQRPDQKISIEIEKFVEI
jgi:hypothetical protein